MAGDISGSWVVLRALGTLWLVSVGLTVFLLALASWRLRPAYVHQLAGDARPVLGSWVWRDRPPVSDHPVRWKEQYVERALDLPGFRHLPRWSGVVAVFVLTVISSLAILRMRLPAGLTTDRLFAAQGLVVMFVAGLAAGARTCSTISSERERQTWDVLLLTPLTVKQLIRAKVWGTVNVFRPYLIAYTVPAAALAVASGPAAVIWTIGCWACTWVMMYYMAACGIACSARSASSWKSWLTTLLWGYGRLLGPFFLMGLPLGIAAGGVLALAMASIVWSIGGGPAELLQLMSSTADLIPLAPFLCTAIFVFADCEVLLLEAERQLARIDRIPQGLRIWPKPAQVPA
jgi:hypothetical protein